MRPTPEGNGRQRFEIDGADLAAAFLSDAGLPADGVGVVWDAIALHTSPGIAERKRPEITQAEARPTKAPPFSPAAELVRQRTGRTSPTLDRTSRWDDFTSG